MTQEDLALRQLADALDYFMTNAPSPRGGAWRKVMEARATLAEVRNGVNENPFALGHD